MHLTCGHVGIGIQDLIGKLIWPVILFVNIFMAKLKHDRTLPVKSWNQRPLKKVTQHPDFYGFGNLYKKLFVKIK